MATTSHTWQDLDRDVATVRAVSAGVDRLTERLETLQQTVGAAPRGYFLPDEDDAVKRLFLAYRNYRIALFDVIARHQEFARDPDETRRLPRFLLAYGAAVLLYNWSALLVHCYRDVPTIRAKLNEEDRAFGIEPGLFDAIYESLTRFENLERLHGATLYFLRQRGRFRDAVAPLGPDWQWLLGEARRQYRWVRRSWRRMFADRWSETLGRLRHEAAAPLQELGYRFRVMIMDLFGNLWLDRIPEIPAAHRRAFVDLMEPADFFIVRPERKSSTVFLPGWWTHAAFYQGGADVLGRFGLDDLPPVRRHWGLLGGTEPPTIIEAIAAGVVMNSLAQSLHVDHAVAIRPRLSAAARRDAVASAFANVGKEYDFELDFTRSDRLVCTEIIWRALHGRENIRFAPVRRFGRPTLSADDVVHTVLAEGAPFDVLAISLNRPTGQEFLTAAAAAAALRKTME